MRAVVVNEFGGPEVLRVQDVDVPAVGTKEMRIRVAATTVNPVDAQYRAGYLAGAVPEPAHRIPGMDVAGVVDAVGPDVTDFVVGDHVVALVPFFATGVGAYAEFVVVPGTAVAPAPSSVDLVHAATIPLNGITALAALDAAAVQPGSTLLVTGAAGAVGGYAVELASAAGSNVVALAGAGDEELVRGLGASHFVARGDDSVSEILRLFPGGVDAVVDAAAVGASLLPAVRDEGAFAVVSPQVAPEPERGITIAPVYQTPDGERLRHLVAETDAGRLTTRVARTMPLADASAAHDLLQRGGIRGRIVLTPATP